MPPGGARLQPQLEGSAFPQDYSLLGTRSGAVVIKPCPNGQTVDLGTDSGAEDIYSFVNSFVTA